MKKIIALSLSFIAASAAYSEIKIIEPTAGAVVPVLTDAQKAYVSMDRQTRREKFADAEYRSKEMGLPAETVPGAKKPREAYWPKTVRLAWEAKDGVEYRVAVRDTAKGTVVVDEKAKCGELYIDNLEIAASYEWTVEGDGDSGKGTFKTEDRAPRLIRYPGVPNVRDLGGYIGLGGRRAKQGMIIRSAGLNNNAYDTYYTTDELKKMGKFDKIKAEAEAAQKRLNQLLAWQADPKTLDREDAEYKGWRSRHVNEPVTKFLSSRVNTAKAAVKKGGEPGGEPKVKKGKMPGKSRVDGENGAYIRARFGIKSDIDLRSDGECYGMTGSPLGDTVTWFHYPSRAYDRLQVKSGKEAFTKVFKVFLDEKNYPIDFHCIAGQDRTGAVSFILGALLGYDENILYLDWELTGFWNRGPSFNHKNRFDHLVSGFAKNYPADTIHESVVKYVRDLGFTDDDIAKFRSIMLTER
ncbi:MAG: tyrosine-protein phosphatase [Kiritimatiellae bacterium]|nr:tyrosine-protein phosphatase [Kiritimatiellia bacterium]